MTKKRGLQKKLVAKINKILERDMPGWKVAPGEKINAKQSSTLYIKVTNGDLLKIVIIYKGRVRSAQG